MLERVAWQRDLSARVILGEAGPIDLLARGVQLPEARKDDLLVRTLGVKAAEPARIARTLASVPAGACQFRKRRLRADFHERPDPFGARVVTARGLIVATDNNGRFHITCAVVPDEDRGSNFILKLDERSLPSGYRPTTENPRVERATRGKMLRFGFGAALHRVVRMDIADGAFEPDTTRLRIQWTPRIAELLEELKKGPSLLRLSYLGDVESKGLALKRLDALKKEITARWKQSGAGYRLTIETEFFWRRGAPVAGRR